MDDDVKAEEREEQAGQEALAGHEPEAPAAQADQEESVAEDVPPESMGIAETADASPASDEAPAAESPLGDRAEAAVEEGNGVEAAAEEADGVEAAVQEDERADAAAEEGDVADTDVHDEAAAEGEDGAEAPLEEEEFKRPAAELKAIVEALIFASPDPLTPKALLKLLDNEPKEDVLAALEDLTHDYDRPGGLQLVEVAGGYQIVTRPDLHEWVRRLFHERSTQKLSVQALETLAVIAYRQPITAIEITEIRGVNTSGVLNTLLERHLIKIVGRKQVVGRPFMYSTTKEFLIRFGLKDLGDLPKVEDMAESLGIESTLLVEQTPPEEQLPLSEPEADDVETMTAADDVTDPEE